MGSFEEVEKLRKQLGEAVQENWLQHTLFTWQWWLMIAIIFVSWAVWWLLVDRRRFVELVIYGMWVAGISALLDLIGTNLFFWGYPVQAVWVLLPPLLSIDLSLMPVKHMLVYQYFYSWKRYLVAIVILAAISAFVAEPLFVMAGIYKMYSWKYIYSFAIYIVRAVFARYVTKKIMSYQKT